MLKIVAQTFLGLLIVAVGLYIGYFYITGIDQGSNPWLLALAIPIVGGGAFILFRAGKSDDTVVKKTSKVPFNFENNQFTEEKAGLESTIQKNNDLTKQWSKTNEARNRLRMLELSAEANKE